MVVLLAGNVLYTQKLIPAPMVIDNDLKEIVETPAETVNLLNDRSSPASIRAKAHANAEHYLLYKKWYE